MTTPLLRASLVALSVLAAGPVLAQATNDTATDAVETVDVADEDNGFDLGWLGLLGLLGLAGLRRREPVAVVTTRSTTPR